MKKRIEELELIQIFLVSTRLGLTSFGGPTAHLGYFHNTYVKQKKWIDDTSYADLVALAQFLPGPASSQVGVGIGIVRGGLLGGMASLIGFTFPSVFVLIIFSQFINVIDVEQATVFHGLKLVAVAVVAHAIIGMAKSLTPRLTQKAIALLSLSLVLLWQTVFTQVIAIIIAGFVGLIVFKSCEKLDQEREALFPISKRVGVWCITLFIGLLISLPLITSITSNYWVDIFDRFYRAGALVFGGGHVVLPLLEKEFVATGLMSKEMFLAGYGLTQAVPGPLFTFAAYIGAVLNGWFGGLFATIVIFLPAFLLIIGALPFWNELRKNKKMRGAITGINASVVGILIAALYDPIWTSSVYRPIDFVSVALLFSMLSFWKLPPWTVVLTGGIAGILISLI